MAVRFSPLRLAFPALALLALAVLLFWLPRMYDVLFMDRMEKTQLFFSPVSQRFVYTEKSPGFDPQAAALAEDHHGDILYKDQDGCYYSRNEFEALLPFIYYRNMALRGLLPLKLDGRSITEEEIRASRLVLELPARAIRGKTPLEEVFPLFESRPDQAGLVFPDDRCRLAPQALEWINADYNRVDPQLTALFTTALMEAGFVFPARMVAGNFTILKAFDDGVLLVDAENNLFHLVRVQGQPQVTRLPVYPPAPPRHISISENKSGNARGLLLDETGALYLLAREDYALIPLPLKDYDPDTMDFKIIFDPLYRTAIYSDERVIRAVVMDAGFTPLAEYSHTMSRGVLTWKHILRDALFPVNLVLTAPDTRLARPGLRFMPFTQGTALPWAVLVNMLLAGFAIVYGHRVRGRRVALHSLLLMALTGICGLLLCLIWEEDS